MNRHSKLTVAYPLGDNLAGAVSTAVPATFSPCDECEGTGFFVSGAFHPDDPRCEATWDCDECAGTGEVDYETPEYRGPSMTMEQVQQKLAEVFGPKPGWERIEL